MAMLSTIDVAFPQLYLDVKASGSLVPPLNVQALLTVLHQPTTHAIGTPVLLTSTVIYPVGELSNNLQPTSHMA